MLQPASRPCLALPYYGAHLPAELSRSGAVDLLGNLHICYSDTWPSAYRLARFHVLFNFPCGKELTHSQNGDDFTNPIVNDDEIVFIATHVTGYYLSGFYRYVS